MKVRVVALLVIITAVILVVVGTKNETFITVVIVKLLLKIM